MKQCIILIDEKWIKNKMTSGASLQCSAEFCIDDSEAKIFISKLIKIGIDSSRISTYNV